MPGFIPILSETRKADVDLSAANNVGRAVKVTASNGCALCTAGAGTGGDFAFGLIALKPKVGIGASVAITLMGTAKGRAGAAFAVGARLKTDANGRLIAVGAEAASTLVNVVGVALGAAAALDDLVEVQLAPHSYVV